MGKTRGDATGIDAFQRNTIRQACPRLLDRSNLHSRATHCADLDFVSGLICAITDSSPDTNENRETEKREKIITVFAELKQQDQDDSEPDHRQWVADCCFGQRSQACARYGRQDHRRNVPCPTKIIRSRHSSLIERTKRSANAFKLGDRGGYRVTAVLDSAIRRRNCAVYFVSRSTINWVLSAKQPAN